MKTFSNTVALDLVGTMVGTAPCVECWLMFSHLVVHRDAQYMMLLHCRRDLLNEETARAYVRWVRAHEAANMLPPSVGWAVGILGVN